MWAGADTADPRRPEYNVPAELYNLDCVAYESLVLGLFTIFRGERTDREKPNDVCVGYSRDGFHWVASRSRARFSRCPNSVGDWNWANVQSAGGCCLVVGDQLYFYVSGRRGVPGIERAGHLQHGAGDAPTRRVRVDGSPASGTRRRARATPSPPPGTLITRPIRFSGRHLFVNVDAAGGELARRGARPRRPRRSRRSRDGVRAGPREQHAGTPSPGRAPPISRSLPDEMSAFAFT